MSNEKCVLVLDPLCISLLERILSLTCAECYASNPPKPFLLSKLLYFLTNYFLTLAPISAYSNLRFPNSENYSYTNDNIRKQFFAI